MKTTTSDTFRQNPTLSAFSSAQTKVILSLAQGVTISKAAQSAGIHRSTVHDWLKNDQQFAAALRQARKEYVLTLRDELQELTAMALSTLRSLLEEPATPASVRFRCALALLERPQFPAGWSLPESINTPRHDEFQREFALLKAEMDAQRLQSAAARARRPSTADDAEPLAAVSGGS